MVLCRFWARGQCNKGDNCQFEHPAGRSQQQNQYQGRNQSGGGGGQQHRNPFDAHQDEPRRQQRESYRPHQGDSYRPHQGDSHRSNQGDSYRPGQGRYQDDRSTNRSQPSHNRSNDTVNPRNQRFNDQAILSDMTDELPGYHLSNYAGAGTTDVPKHFFHPDMEVSPEELRVQFYLARAQGREAEAVAMMQTLENNAQQEIMRVRNDVQGAIRQVVAAKREHPNRWDLIDQQNSSWTLGPDPFQPGPFPGARFAESSSNAGQPPQHNPFGQPSQPRAQGGFGQPSQVGTGGGFGQRSQAGAAGGFGQPSQPGGGGIFGQPSQVGGSGGFGQPSQVGQQQNPFTQAAQSAGSNRFQTNGQAPSQSAFGQPSVFRQPSVQQQAPSLSGASNPFGVRQPTAFSNQQPHTPGPFGSTSQQQSQSPFGQPTQQQPPGGFGQPSLTQVGGFGQPSQTQVGGFGQPSQTQVGGFGQPSGASQLTNGLNQNQRSQPNPFNQQPAATNGLAQPSLQLNTNQPIANGNYTTNPTSATPHDADPPEEMYEGKKDEFKDAYQHVLQTGHFKDGVMPEIAPQHDWVGWGDLERKFQA